jgi:hypothetical protein
MNQEETKMKKSRKFIAAGIITLTAVIGISVYAYANIREDNTLHLTTGGQTKTAVTSEQTEHSIGISAEDARETVLSKAVSEYGIQESSVKDIEIEREYEGGTEVWEVTFDAVDQDNRYCEFEYHVSGEDGTITHHCMEHEDVD